MKTRELFPDNNEPRYVTFALAGVETSHNYSWRHARDREERERFLSRNGACLLFEIGKSSAKEVMSSVAGTPFVVELFGAAFWLTVYKDKVVVASGIIGQARRENPPICFGLAQKGELLTWTPRELDHQCMKLEKFVHCYACPYEGLVGGCLESQAQLLLGKAGNTGPLPNKELTELGTEDEALETFLQRVAPRAGWTYIKPGNFADPYETRLAYVTEIHMNESAEKLEDARARWELGKQTQVSNQTCQERCCLYDWCDRPQKPYYNSSTRCQHESDGGPYSEQEIHEVFQRFRQEKNARPQEEIAQIAANSGASTYIFGHELMLCKMESNMRDVEFIRPYTMERFSYSYEDAMTLLHTSYRSRNRDGVVYVKPEMHHVEAQMTDSELDIYTQLCQYTSAKDYCTKYPGCYVTPLIQTIRWRPQSDFYLTLKPGWDLQIRHLGQIGPIVGDYRTEPGILRSNGSWLRDVRGLQEPETSPDTQP